MDQTHKRPVYLNVLRIRMPVTAVLSIAHRVTGVLLFLVFPVFVYLFDLSLRNPSDFAKVHAILFEGAGKYAVGFILWALAHHFFAGVRYLLIDLRIGAEKRAARVGAWIVWACDAAALIAIAEFLQ